MRCGTSRSSRATSRGTIAPSSEQVRHTAARGDPVDGRATGPWCLGLARQVGGGHLADDAVAVVPATALEFGAAVPGTRTSCVTDVLASWARDSSRSPRRSSREEEAYRDAGH